MSAARSILAAVHFAELTEVEQRVLGCLIEKRWTTPEQYPLSLNALRLACNQATNRDPVTRYDEDAVFAAAQRLTKYGLARLASGHTSRATKFRHLAEEGLGLDREQLAVLAVLLLRGPQTPGELKLRSERMASLASLADVERILDELGQRGYAQRLGRRPGQKEDRFRQLLGGADDATGNGAGAPASRAPAGDPAPPADPAPAADPAPTPDPAPAAAPAPTPAPAPAPAPAAISAPVAVPAPAAIPSQAPVAQLEARVASLEADVAALRAQLSDLLG